jgi:hypothetical protein
MGGLALEDNYKEMALLWEWEERAQAAINTPQSEHQRQS